MAHKENKGIFVDVYTSWCGPCKKMASMVFADTVVADYMNKHFVSVKLDAEKGKDHELFKELQPHGYPTFYWFDAEGSLADTQTGFMPAEKFVEASRKALENNFGKRYGLYRERWLKGERDYEFVKDFLFNVMPKVQADSVRPYMNVYLQGLSETELKSKQTGSLLRGFLREIKDDAVWKTLVAYNDVYQSYFGYEFGKQMYMNLIRIPMADRNDTIRHRKDLDCIASVEFPQKRMYQEIRDMETALFKGDYTGALKQALLLGDKYEKDFSYLYSEMFYSFIIAGFFVDTYTPTVGEQEQILQLGEKAFALTPSQCTLMYLSAAYARRGDYDKAYKCLAYIPFYSAPTLSSAVYPLLNIKKGFPLMK